MQRGGQAHAFSISTSNFKVVEPESSSPSLDNRKRLCARIPRSTYTSSACVPIYRMVPSNYSPIPGAGLPARGLFIDRWGTLLETPTEDFCESFSDAKFTPGAIDTLFHACQSGWNIYLVGNEDPVAFGKLSDEKWKALESNLIEHLRAHGVTVKRCYSCLDNPDGKAPHDKESVFLFPNTGVMYHAAQMDGIILSESWVIGDGALELVSGWRAGCRLACIGDGSALSESELKVEPEVQAMSLSQALSEIGAGVHTGR